MVRPGNTADEAHLEWNANGHNEQNGGLLSLPAAQKREAARCEVHPTEAFSMAKTAPQVDVAVPLSVRCWWLQVVGAELLPTLSQVFRPWELRSSELRRLV